MAGGGSVSSWPYPTLKSLRVGNSINLERRRDFLFGILEIQI
jgi:hypothetical protein